MNLKSKSTLIILATFLLGILVGVFSSSWMMRQRWERVLGLTRPKDMKERVLEDLAPLDPVIADSVSLILTRAIDEGRTRMKDTIDSAYVECGKYLTPEQIEILRSHMQKRGKRIGKFLNRPPHEPGGPPPDEPPGGPPPEEPR